MRIAIGGLMHESATFSRVPTELDDFTVDEADAIRTTALAEHDEVSGALAALAGLPQVEVVPTVCAGATPSGLVSAHAYGAIQGRLLDALRRAGPLDGVLLTLHGSTTVRGFDDAQGDLATSVRETVGTAVPIVATLDLHATPSDRVLGNVDALVAYRTAPHRDACETGARAAALLWRIVTTAERPAMAFARLPLLLPGELGQTELEPMASLMRSARTAEAALPEIWSVSILQGYPWADLPEPGVSVVVVADAAAGAEPTARSLARDLQAQYWSIRDALHRSVEVLSVAEALAAARGLAAEGRLVYLCDSGDNPTAGADCDDARLEHALLASGLDRVTFGPIADPPAVAACRRAGLGEGLRVALGGRPSRRPEIALTVDGWVSAVATDREGGGLVRLTAGNTELLVSERRLGMRDPGILSSVGIDPAAPGSVHVLKSGYLFPAFADLVARTPGARAMLMATPGASSLDLRQIPYRRVRRPVYPLDVDVPSMPDVVYRPPLGVRR